MKSLMRWLAAALAVAISAAIGHAQERKTAGQVYLEYRAAFEKALAIEEILPFMDKATAARIEQMHPHEQQLMFDMLQVAAGSTREVKVANETKTAQGVELTVEGLAADQKKVTGTIQMLSEDGAWKVGREAWR